MIKQHLIKLNRIVVYGGASIEVRKDGSCWAKPAIVKYLRDIGGLIEETVFMAPRADNLPEGKHYSGQLNWKGLRVIPLRPGWRGRLEQLKLIYELAANSGVILYLPNALSCFPLASFIRNRASVLAVYIANDFQSHAETHSFRFGKFGQILYLLGFRTLIRAAHLVIARGKRSIELAKPYNSNTHLTLPLGNIELSKPLPNMAHEFKKGEVHLLFVGKVLWRKGVRELLEALSILNGTLSEKRFKLTVVGDGRDKGEAEVFARSIGLGAMVDFVGWVDTREQLDSYWESADILVMPSSQHLEGVPRVIDEAFAKSLPVVATSIGGVAAEFQDGEVLLVSPADSDALAKGIEKIITCESLRNKCVEKGLKRIENWRRYGSAGKQHYQLLKEAEKE